MNKLNTIKLLLIFIVTISISAFAGDDYPFSEECYEIKPECADYYGHKHGLDRSGFYQRQCTSFVAWRMNRDAHTPSPPYSFFNHMTSDNPSDPDRNRWSDAWHWDEHAQDLGITVNNIPQDGAIAQWEAYSWNDYLGHVAYVESVNPDGSVNIEEYNYKPYRWSERNNQHADHYIVFERQCLKR